MATFGNVSGDVVGNVQFKDRVTAYQGISGAGLQVVKDSNIWYVDKNKTGPASSGDGKSWDNAFLTVTEAISAAGDYDIIFIGQGVYSEATTLAITQTGLKIFGAGTSGFVWGPTSLKSDTCADDLITINSNGVEIAGLDFICNTDNKSAIVMGDTTTTYKTHIHDCHFGGGTGEYGIECDLTQDTVDMHVDRCEFYDYASAGILLSGTRCKVTGSLFFIPADGIGIDIRDTGANRPDKLIANNMMIGSADGDTGIKIPATEPTDGTLLVFNNCVTNCNTNITQDKSDAGVVNNPTYGDSAAPVVVDPNA
jgi:hypothetical protein